MRDYLFFPIAGLVLLAMIAAAVAPGPAYQRKAMAALGDPDTGLLIEAATLSTFQIPEGISLNLIDTEIGTVARVAAFKRVDTPPLSAGAFLTLPNDFETAFAGKTIRVSVQARRSAENGSPHFWLRYFAGEGQEQQEWRDIAVDGELRTYEFDWTLPPTDGAADYIGVWPDPEGLGRSVEIVRLSAWIADKAPPVGLRGGDW